MFRKQMIEEYIKNIESVSDFTKQMLMGIIDKKTINGEYIIQNVNDLVSLVKSLEDLKD